METNDIDTCVTTWQLFDQIRTRIPNDLHISSYSARMSGDGVWCVYFAGKFSHLYVSGIDVIHFQSGISLFMAIDENMCGDDKIVCKWDELWNLLRIGK